MQEMNRPQKFTYGRIVSTKKINRLQNVFILLSRRNAGNESTAKVCIQLDRKHAANESNAKVFIGLNHNHAGNESNE